MSKKLSALSLAGMVLLAVSCGGASAPPAAQPAAAPAPPPAPVIAAGTSVAAPWQGQDDYFLAVVLSVDGAKAMVRFVDDNQEMEKPVDALIPVIAKTWQVGDRVRAVYSAGRFYAGEITEVKPANLYTVKWADGTSPSDVEGSKIIAP